MRAAHTIGIVIARFFLSSIFLSSAISTVFHWQEQERNLLNVLSEWQSYTVFSDPLQELFSFLVPWTPVLLIGATLFEFLGGLLVLLGVRERFGAFLLILFLIPTTVIMHQFWFVDGIQREVQVIHFLKNLAILGGLLLLLLNGSQGGMRSPGGFPPIKLG